MEGLFSSLGLKPVPGSSMAVLGKHNPLLVILSFLIALFAVRAFLELSRHIMTVQSRRQRSFWILAAAVSFGGGIWSMHFTAMLAYHVGVPIHYDWGRTLLSLAIPVAVAAAGLAILAGWHRAVARHPVLGPIPALVPILLVGLLTGLSLVLMHYLGMTALHMHALVYYRPGYIWLTVCLGAAGGIALLWLTARRPRRGDPLMQWGVSLIMAIAVSAMHYAAMSGTEVMPEATQTLPLDQHLFSRTILSLAIFGTMSVLFLFLSLGIRVDRRLREGDRELERLQGYLNAVVNSVRNYAIFMINKDGLIKTWNTGATAIFYVPEATALGSHLARFIARGEELVARANDNPAGVSRNLNAMRADGSEFNAYIVLEPVYLEGECQGHGVFVQDLTHFLRTREQLTSLRDEARRFEFLANHDSLTGLLNRRAFLQQVSESLADRTASAEHWLMLCDLDHFKQVNDRYGHDVGDQVLRVFSQRARGLFGDAVPLARFGGEEFMALLPGDRETAADQVRRLVRTMEASPVAAGNDVVPVTVSLGLAPCPSGADDDLQITIQQADAALYHAKLNGRNQAVFFELRVLLIDPDPARADNLRQRIQAQATLPVRVMTTRDGMQAISLANQYVPHLLIVHPPLSGIDVRRFLAWSESEFPGLNVAMVGDLPELEAARLPAGTLRLDPPLTDARIFRLLTDIARQIFHILPSRVPGEAVNNR